MSGSKLINNKKFRALLAQFLLIVILTISVWYLASNAIKNLEIQGIASGFDYLWYKAGFDLYSPFIDYTAESTYLDAYKVGLINTVLISFWGIVFASIVGFIVGIARLSKNYLVSRTAYWFVEGTRNVPMLVWIVIWYYGIFLHLPQVRQSINIADSIFLNNRGLYIPRPEFGDSILYVIISFVIGVFAFFVYRRYVKKVQNETGKRLPVTRYFFILWFAVPIFVFLLLGMPVEFTYPKLQGFNFEGGIFFIPEFTALLVAMSLYTSASIAELVRGGIISVSKGQTEASLSLNMTKGQTMRLIIIPQALRVIIPPLNSIYMSLTKNSSLGVAVGYMEITNVMGGTILNQTGQALECMLLVMVTYLILSLITSIIMNKVNATVQIVER